MSKLRFYLRQSNHCRACLNWRISVNVSAVKDAAARLQAPILLVATAAELAGISSRVTRQGRIFYDAAVINGFRYNDKRLYAGEEYADLAIYSEYVGFGFTPWSDLL